MLDLHRQAALILIEDATHLCRDRESRRDRQSRVSHLCESRPLSPEEIEAAYAYIKCGQSPSAAGLGIYAHKNTVCNRVKRFVGKTGIDLSLFSNQLFVYLLGNEWKKTLQRG